MSKPKTKNKPEEKKVDLTFKIDKGEEISLLRDDIITLINSYGQNLNGYELLGLVKSIEVEVCEICFLDSEEDIE